MVITARPVRLVTFIDSAFLRPRRVLAPGPSERKIKIVITDRLLW